MTSPGERTLSLLQALAGVLNKGWVNCPFLAYTGWSPGFAFLVTHFDHIVASSHDSIDAAIGIFPSQPDSLTWLETLHLP